MENGIIGNVETVIAYIEEHLDGKLDLDTVAEAVHYSKYHLHRMFSGTVGMTLHDYVQRRQLTEAAKLAIVEASYDPQYGARPLRRYVQHTVETMLSKKLLRGDILPGQIVTVDAADGELILN